MYSGLVQTVEIPKGKVKILKNGYVYWITKSHWDNDRKMTVDDRTNHRETRSKRSNAYVPQQEI